MDWNSIFKHIMQCSVAVRMNETTNATEKSQTQCREREAIEGYI